MLKLRSGWDWMDVPPKTSLLRGPLCGAHKHLLLRITQVEDRFCTTSGNCSLIVLHLVDKVAVNSANFSLPASPSPSTTLLKSWAQIKSHTTIKTISITFDKLYFPGLFFRIKGDHVKQPIRANELSQLSRVQLQAGPKEKNGFKRWKLNPLEECLSLCVDQELLVLQITGCPSFLGAKQKLLKIQITALNQCIFSYFSFRKKEGKLNQNKK